MILYAIPMTSVELSINFVNWNFKGNLQNCIELILLNSFGIEYKIKVVDSASFDGCGYTLQDSYPHVLFIPAGLSTGYGNGA
jgi:hypothetical protein